MRKSNKNSNVWSVRLTLLVVPEADIAKYVADIHVQMCNNGLVFWMFIYFQVNAICFYLCSVGIQNPFEKIQLYTGCA